MIMQRAIVRIFRPATLALAAASAVFGVSWIIGERVYGPFDKTIGSVSVTVSIVLFLSWWLDSHRARRVGLLLSVGLWSAVSAAALLGLGSWTSGLLALCWAFLAGGSYWVEANDKGIP